MILTLRTDKPESEIGLFEDQQQVVYETWAAHRQLAETLHKKIKELLSTQSKDWTDISGLVVYKGPGSFTGLRIGLSVANALADSLQVPIVGGEGDDWCAAGLQKLQAKVNEKQIIPEYGGEVFITPPKK